MDEYEEAVLFTFALLESRLDRLEYVLRGVKQPEGEKPKTVTERMQKIDKSLQELSAKTALLHDARELCMCLCIRQESNEANRRSKQAQGHAQAREAAARCRP
jgi:hypothetical protein